MGHRRVVGVQDDLRASQHGSGQCWGSGTNLGYGDTEARGAQASDLRDRLGPIDLGTGRTAQALMTSGTDTCAILDTGELKCWGSNLSLTLGVGDRRSRGTQPGEMGDALPTVRLGTGRTVHTISVNTHACALLDTGEVNCWGRNVDGELGLGDQVSRGDVPGHMGDALPSVRL